MNIVLALIILGTGLYFWFHFIGWIISNCFIKKNGNR